MYERIGGEDTFVRLVDLFYQRVDGDSVLRFMFPPDLTEAKDRLARFLMQYFGGPATYSERRGHPRLRLRHQPFAIGPAERDRWVAHMLAAIDAVGIPDPERSELATYIERTGTFLINKPHLGLAAKPDLGLAARPHQGPAAPSP